MLSAPRSALAFLFRRSRDGAAQRQPDAAGLDEARALVEELEQEQDPARVSARIAARLGDLSGCDEVVMCDRVPGDDRFQPRSPDAASDRAPRFAARGPLARWLRVNQIPLLLPDDRDVFHYLPEEEQSEITRIGARTCVPCMLRGQLVGMVLLCRPNGRVPDLADRLDLLQQCCDRATAVWDRALQAQAERERQQAQSRAQQLAAAGQLAAAMAHEIRNPLAAIRSGVQFVAASESAAAEEREVLAEIVAEVDRINRSISNVLSFSRPRELSLAELDVRSIVQQALTLLGPYCRHHQIDLACDAPGTPVMATADPSEVQQVLLNILLNACQASPDGGRVDLSVAAVPGLGGRAAEVHVVVADTGRGMTEAELARAFEPFFTTKANGTGLGLAICRQVMARHGGDIRLSSAPGRGTTATLVFPGPGA